MRTNAEILADLDAAIKGITEVGNLHESILAPGQFDEFIRQMEISTTILPEARFMRMDSPVEHIDRIGFLGWGLMPGNNADGSSHDLTDSDMATPTTATNKLVAEELVLGVSLRDKMLRRNIERERMETTVIELMGEWAGRDLEGYAVLADKGINASEPKILKLTDNWAKLSPNKVFGTGSDKDFDPADPESIFEALMAAVPKQFFVDRSQWRLYVPWEVENAYRDVLKTRGTALGDTSQTSNQPLYYKGFLVKVCPTTDRSPSVADGGRGKIAMLQHPDNIVWGVFKEVGIEPERSARKRATDHILVVEADAGYEDENASAVAYLDLDADTFEASGSGS